MKLKHQQRNTEDKVRVSARQEEAAVRAYNRECQRQIEQQQQDTITNINKRSRELAKTLEKHLTAKNQSVIMRG